MIRFTSDYCEGAHPTLLAALADTNLEGNPGYGTDDHCQAAARMLCRLIGQPDAQVHFLTGGTQTNQTAIAAFLRPHEAAICAASGHINVHETGAIEATGHKCLAIYCPDGKLTPGAVQAVLDAHTDEHMVKPKLVYISQATEVGTVYSLEELRALRRICDEKGLYLYLDGARLASALALGSISLTAVASLTDAFYIGGTKNGALFGEALVICNPALQPDFRYLIKQRGGMLAKGWLLGVQFEKLFENGGALYLELGRHANEAAARLREGLKARDVLFDMDSPSNQLFVQLPESVLEGLQPDFTWTDMKPAGSGRRSIRLVTSWATTPEQVDAFLAALDRLSPSGQF